MARPFNERRFDEEWFAKKVKAHKKLEAKRKKLEEARDAAVAKAQLAIDIERELEEEARRTAYASACNFERKYGEAAYFAIVKRLRF